MTVALPQDSFDDSIWLVQHLFGSELDIFPSGVLTALANSEAGNRHVLVIPSFMRPEDRITELRDHNVDASILHLDHLHMPAHDPDSPSSPTRKRHMLRNAFSSSLAQLIRQQPHRVVILVGTLTGELKSSIRSIGKMSSEALAAFAAAGLNAAELVLWKDVDGVFTADPMKVPTARLLPVISFSEMAELTNRCPDICDAAAIQQAYYGRVPIRIRNVNNPACPGTLVHPDPETTPQVKVSSRPVETFQGMRISDFAREEPKQARLPTAVTIREHVHLIDISSYFASMAQASFVAEVIRTLNCHAVAVDLISTSETHVSVAVHAVSGELSLSQLVEELEEFGTVSIRQGLAILSLIGRRMPSMIGIAGRLFTTLAQRNVNIEMMSQSASEINISCVIDGKDAMKALNLVHHSCLASPQLSW